MMGNDGYSGSSANETIYGTSAESENMVMSEKVSRPKTTKNSLHQNNFKEKGVSTNDVTYFTSCISVSAQFGMS